MRFLEQPKPIQTDDYFGIEAVSQSALKLLGKSESAYYHTYITKRMQQEETDAMKRGTAFDLAILEPERAANEIVKIPAELLPRSKTVYKAFAAENADKLLLTPDEYEALNWQVENIYACKPARELLNALDERHYRLTAFAESDNGLWRGPTKCELDGLSFAAGTIIDLKTTRSPRAAKFARDANQLGYHVQGGWYSVHANVAHERHFNYSMIVVGNVPPYDVHVETYRRDRNGADCAAILSGMSLYNRYLNRLGECLRDNDWQIPEAKQVNEVAFEPWMEVESE